MFQQAVSWVNPQQVIHHPSLPSPTPPKIALTMSPPVHDKSPAWWQENPAGDKGSGVGCVIDQGELCTGWGADKGGMEEYWGLMLMVTYSHSGH